MLSSSHSYYFVIKTSSLAIREPIDVGISLKHVGDLSLFNFSYIIDNGLDFCDFVCCGCGGTLRGTYIGTRVGTFLA